MSQPLLNMVAKKVGHSIVRGEYSDVDFTLPENLSNVVYQAISQEWPSADCDETKKKLGVTSLKLFSKPLTDDEYTFINSQNLKNLELKRFDFATPFRKRSPGDGSYNVNIVGCLQKLLNKESQKILTSLTINGKGANFPDNWMKDIRQLLPAVDFLNLANCTLSPQEYTNLCNSFTTITKLDISKSKVQDLAGISNIPNLQYLNLNGLVFDNREQIIELFELQQLRVLNIGASAPGLTNNLKSYMQSGKVLSELRILDCLGADINLEELNQLVQSHPLLNMVVLIETPLKRTPQLDLPNRTINLLTTESLPCCLKSLKYATDVIAAKIPVVTAILDEMDRCIKDQNSTPKDRKECLKVILAFIVKYNRFPKIQEKGFRCLQSLWKKPEIFELNERQQVIGAVLKSMPPYHGPFEEDREVENCHTAGWSVLSSDEILDTMYTTPKNTDTMCLLAGELVDRAETISEMVEIGFLVLSRLLTKMSPRGAVEFVGHLAWIRIHFTKFLRDQFDVVEERCLNVILKLIYELTYLVRDNAMDPVVFSLNQGCLMSYVETLQQVTDESMKERTMEIMEDFLKLIHVRTFDVFFQRNGISAFLPLFLEMNTGKQRAAISVLVTMFHCIEDSENTASPTRDKERLVNDIITSISTFEQGEHVDRFSVLQWVELNPANVKVFEWARWLLGRCGVDIEEGAENVAP